MNEREKNNDRRDREKGERITTQRKVVEKGSGENESKVPPAHKHSRKIMNREEVFFGIHVTVPRRFLWVLPRRRRKDMCSLGKSGETELRKRNGKRRLEMVEKAKYIREIENGETVSGNRKTE